MNERGVVTTIYDLLANNTEYEPREQWQVYEAEQIEDYWVDSTDAGEFYIGLRDQTGGEYRLVLQKIYQSRNE